MCVEEEAESVVVVLVRAEDEVVLDFDVLVIIDNDVAKDVDVLLVAPTVLELLGLDDNGVFNDDVLVIDDAELVNDEIVDDTDVNEEVGSVVVVELIAIVVVEVEVEDRVKPPLSRVVVVDVAGG